MRIQLANPRGFCAGVDRAIEIVNRALEVFGAPIYVRHEVVHNRYVVERLRGLGAVFVEELDEVPDDATVIFSAHGVSRAVQEEARGRGLKVFDATCPLVTKVHNEAKRFLAKGYLMLYIGHKGHVEAVGTMGHAPGQMILVETPEEAERVELPSHDRLAVLTQTTLSVEEVERTLAVLRRRFPHLELPAKEDICFATTNRQAAVRQMAALCDLVLVVGSQTSSNSNRLREVAESLGCEAHLILSADEIRPEWKSDFPVVGITSGASTPEDLVQAVVGSLIAGRPDTPIEVVEAIREEVSFRPSRDLLALAVKSA